MYRRKNFSIEYRVFLNRVEILFFCIIYHSGSKLNHSAIRACFIELFQWPVLSMAPFIWAHFVVRVRPEWTPVELKPLLYLKSTLSLVLWASSNLIAINTSEVEEGPQLLLTSLHRSHPTQRRPLFSPLSTRVMLFQVSNNLIKRNIRRILQVADILQCSLRKHLCDNTST